MGVLESYHNAFSLLEGEGGETALTEMTIDTSDTPPGKHPVRRVPFVLRRVTRQAVGEDAEGGSYL